LREGDYRFRGRKQSRLQKQFESGRQMLSGWRRVNHKIFFKTSVRLLQNAFG
jgi:hypothetical protein